MEIQAKEHRFSGALESNNIGTKSSKECKAAVFQVSYEWFKEIPFTNLNKNYLGLGEVIGKEAFMGCMRRLFVDAISLEEEWDEDKQKHGYSGWLEDKVVDMLYNTQPVLDRYMKLQDVLMNNEELLLLRSRWKFFMAKRRISPRSRRKVVQLGNRAYLHK